MTYKEKITDTMTRMARDPRVLFVGYNVRCGKSGGTLAGVPEPQLIETTVAENLMLGMAIGLSVDGWKPVVYFERMDFLMNAMDAIVNHLAKIEEISIGHFRPKVIVRCVVGNREIPLFTGATHTQDFTLFLRGLLPDFYIETIENNEMVSKKYTMAAHGVKSAIITEYKDLYAKLL